MSYDNWKTYTPCQFLKEEVCSECERYEAVADVWKGDDENGWARVAVCHLCVKNFEKPIYLGERTEAADKTRETPAIQPTPGPFI